MISFKKQDNKHILTIENEVVEIESKKVEEKQFLAIIEYKDEEGKLLEAEIFYHPEEQEVDNFLDIITEGNQQKYQLTEELFTPAQ